MQQRPLGTSGLQLPVVGMGTWKTFDVVSSEEIEGRRRVADTALDGGITLFETSPIYGNAERVLSKALSGRRDRAIVADKIWTPDDDAAIEQLRRAFELYENRVEIYQVHNLVAWQTRLTTLEQIRAQG